MGMKAHVFERGDKIYLVSPVTPITLGAEGVDELAFAAQLKKMAPNENLMWLNGRYVEGGSPNANGQMWREGDVAIKALQPVFMPVTIMHDYRTAVGLIADTKLLVPEAAEVPRSRIDTTLGIWSHRFPEVAEEIDVNYRAATLMQSMECTSPFYECSVCSELFHKLPGGAEREHWCEHLLGNGSAEAARILGGVTFTGTGLIFGTRGSKGAYDDAHLDVFQDEVAEYHERAHKDSGKKPPRRRTSMDEITIPRNQYDELQQRPTREELAAAEKRATDAEGARDEATTKLEAEEAKSKQLQTDLDAEKAKVEAGEEANRKGTLRDERLGKLGEGFMAKLGETSKARLKEQAGDMSDEDWSARLEELAELVGVKPDEGKPEGDPANGNGNGGGSEEFSREEVASAGAGNGNGNPGGEGPSEQNDSSRRSVVGKLMG
jgi:hypothetical protein